LGTFLELEVVLIDGQNPKEGEQIADNMMQSLGIDKVDLIERSYIDLIMDKHETQKIQD
ncbi:MAG: hypothetical protein GTN99_05870, partial [Candidatus Dadabacteria bacterium]|nr:hypothetical protein [Candidatus Dadabacteria bacterium]